MRGRVRGIRMGVSAVLAGVLLVPLTVVSAQAQAQTRGLVASVQASSKLTVEVAPGRAGQQVGVRILLTDAGTPLGGVGVVLERATASGWQALGALVTDASGAVTTSVVLDRSPGLNRFRASTVDGPWTEVQAVLQLAPTTLALSVPAKVVDEKSATIRVRWTSDAGEGVAGQVVLQRRVKTKGRWSTWSDFRSIRTDDAGTASTVVRPRRSHRWRAVASAEPWASGATSPSVLSRNVAPGKAVVFPARAPKPRIRLGAQKRAVGAGANIRITRIPTSVWRSMKGVSWRKGCPVGRDDLRLVETNYWAFDGYRRRGRVVVASNVVSNFRGAFTDLHAAKAPIRSLRLPDAFGRNGKLGGADDMRSMAADNSSAFNCRGVVGHPHRRSPHAWGRSFDLNPWENPFRSGWGLVPNAWWASRSHADVAWRSSGHRVVKILARNGFRWTYGHGDLHHFDAVPGRGARATVREMASDRSFLAAQEACGDTTCD